MPKAEFEIPEQIICPICGPDADSRTTEIQKVPLRLGMVIYHLGCGQHFEIVPDGLKFRTHEEVEKYGPNPWDWRVKQTKSA